MDDRRNHQCAVCCDARVFCFLKKTNKKVGRFSFFPPVAIMSSDDSGTYSYEIYLSLGEVMQSARETSGED